ncbi:hypothetical protein [Vibrio alginolyticus]|uniref:hypothetical protein n=1 Tax=Vibrio alginolyticus TaxID=663 RepID=UPI0015F62560|nr:hypothetical protein [Vibrio alginolyticus]EJE4208766.1 hypothetical protein [Vibrio parahaemolyticus]
MTDQKRLNRFKIHLEKEFPILKGTNILALNIIEQINKYFKENQPEWLQLYDVPKEGDESQFTRPHMLRKYINEKTRSVDYRVNLLQSFILSPHDGRINLDGTTSEITPHDAISVLEMLKNEANFEQLQKGHRGRVFKLAKHRLEHLGD